MHLLSLFKAKVVLWLVAYKKQMMDVDLKMFCFVMPDVLSQPNELVFTLQCVTRFKFYCKSIYVYYRCHVTPNK